MKIALIGDLQYKPGEEQTVFSYMEQVRAWQPELAVSLGDMGSGRQAGTKEAMLQCRAFFDTLPCETVVLLGNHDVEYRPDEDTRLREQEKWHAEVFAQEKPYRAVHCGDTLLLCLSVERQPQELLLSQHALYSSAEQLSWAREQLAAHMGPVIVLSHAPVAGSGLRCCPPVHHAATDAFMGQNFDPWAWRDLLDDHPNIRLWGSAHFHMGHAYERAITVRNGATHLSCGVMCSCARDNTRQTRLMELMPDGRILLSTMDHLAGGEISQDAVLMPDSSLSGRYYAPSEHEFLIGEDRALRVWDAPALGRVYIATESGRLWEYDRALQELTGTICSGEKAVDLSVFCGRIYVQTDSGCFSVPIDSDQRFHRLSGFVPRLERPEDALPAPSLPILPFQTLSAPEGEYILL